MAMDLDNLSAGMLETLAGPVFGTFVTVRPDGSPHATCVSPLWDPEAGIMRLISSGESVKARNLAADGRASVTVVRDGAWVTFEGAAEVVRDDRVEVAMAAYRSRWGEPRAQVEDRIAIELTPDTAMGMWFG